MPMELFGVVGQSEPYAYTNISTGSITPRPRVLLLPTIQSPTEELLSGTGLAPTEKRKRVLRIKERLCQWLHHISTSQTQRAFRQTSLNTLAGAVVTQNTIHCGKQFHGCPLDPRKMFYVKNISAKILDTEFARPTVEYTVCVLGPRQGSVYLVDCTALEVIHA